MSDLRVLRTRMAAAELRTATLRGRENLVTPVVMLVEGVIQTENAAEPELILASEFGKVPEGWNGRPVVPHHPSNGATRVCANTPETYERDQFGQLFHAYSRDGKLGAEAWLDVDRARSLPTGERVLQRVRQHEPVEVSVGVLVTPERRAGQWNGQSYAAIWREIMPDHLALFGDATTGACSVEMGCGAPRAACAKEETPMGIQWKPWRELLTKAGAALGMRDAQALSDVDLRAALDKALRAAVPGYLGIEEVVPSEGQVVYAAAPDPDQITYWRRSFTEEGGEISVAKDEEQVRPSTEFVALSARTPREPQEPAGDARTGGVMTKAERIQALIDDPTTPFTADDRALLEAWSDERLEGLASFAAPTPSEPPQSPPPTPPPTTPPPGAHDAEAPPQPAAAAAHAPLTEEAYLAQAPESIKAIVAEHKAAQAAERTRLAAHLKTAQREYTEAELVAMPLEQLRRLGRVVPAPANGVDYSAQAGARHASDEDQAPPPINLAERIASARRPS